MSHRKWPFYELPVGGSVVIPDKPTLQHRVHHHGYRTGKIFRTRKCAEGRRVERVA